jgi:hypothetical protein
VFVCCARTVFPALIFFYSGLKIHLLTKQIVRRAYVAMCFHNPTLLNSHVLSFALESRCAHLQSKTGKCQLLSRTCAGERLFFKCNSKCTAPAGWRGMCHPLGGVACVTRWVAWHVSPLPSCLGRFVQSPCPQGISEFVMKHVVLSNKPI